MTGSTRMASSPVAKATADPVPARVPTDWRTPVMQQRIAKRYRRERRFRLTGLMAVLLSAGFLVFLIGNMLVDGLPGFWRTEIRLPVDFTRHTVQVDPGVVRAGGTRALQALADANLPVVTYEAAEQAFGDDADSLLSTGAWLSLRDAILADPTILTRKVTINVPASDAIDHAAKHDGPADVEAAYRKLQAAGAVTTVFNTTFLTASDATDPTRVGIWGAFKGSLFTMLVTLGLSFPIGICAAVYLEEYARRNRWTDLIEVSINNLAAVPSIIFGLLGLAVFLNTWQFPRSASLVGGMTLALMTMPVIVIAARNAIKAVPPSIRDAALGIGASPVQVVFHHVLPPAMPGIMTGTIVGMARALGETAPLLMIGMRAFIASPPGGISDPATVLPVQIFLWSDEVSRGFVEKTSAAIAVLLVFLLAMNGLAIYLRNRFERKW